MFFRKVDPAQKQCVTEFLRNFSQWSKEIDLSVDKVKFRLAAFRDASHSSSQELTVVIREALSTIEKVRKTALQSKHWPVLNDVQGMRILMELRLLREDLFKHQILRMHIYSVVNESPKNTPLPDVIQQSIQATTEYESVLSKMSSTTDKLIKRYKFTTAEMLLIKRRSRHPRY